MARDQVVEFAALVLMVVIVAIITYAKAPAEQTSAADAR
jgi:hypothetical protein